MRMVIWPLIVLAILAGGACGGDEPSSPIVTIFPDYERLREGVSEEEAQELFVAIMERRAEFMDGEAEVSVNDDGTLTVEYSGIADDVALDLYLTAGNLSVRGPQMVDDDTIRCLTGVDQPVELPLSSIVYDPTDTGLIPRCRLDDGRPANVAWDEEIEALNVGPLTNTDISTVSLRTEAGPTLVVGLNQDGSLKLASISSQLIGLPMGIFIDGTLVAGPMVADIIPNGQLPIPGLGLSEARILRAQLRAGAVPAPFTIRITDG